MIDDGLGTANVYERWFCHEDVRAACPPEDRIAYSDLQAGELRAAATRRELGGDHRGYALVHDLLRRSSEFQRAWELHRVHVGRQKRLWVADVALEAYISIDEHTGQRLVAFHDVTSSLA